MRLRLIYSSQYYLLCLFAWLATFSLLHAQDADLGKGGVVFSIKIKDSKKLLGEKRQLFESNVKAACNQWSKYLDGNTVINLEIAIVPGDGRAIALCPSPVMVKKIGNNTLYEMSACHKVRTGLVNNKTDIDIKVYGDYLKELWLDPEPEKRAAPLPQNELDTVSLFMHEIAHGLGINGWIEPDTGELKVGHLSTYDRYVIYDRGLFYFVGLNAMKVYGGPVPLSQQHNNYHHTGRVGAEKDAVLDTHLMNGVYFQRGMRYYISPLDLAMLKDCGMPVKEMKEELPDDVGPAAGEDIEKNAGEKPAE